MSDFKEDTLAVETQSLTYRFASNNKLGLIDINLKIHWGTTNLVIGHNGAGKSTLLKILAGKTLVKRGTLKLGGFDPFKFTIDRNDQHNSDINKYITYLGTEWASNPIVKRDIPVKVLISSVGGDTYPDRRDELIKIMDLDPDWSMAYISDGERRRVQLAMGLLKPWRLLLLDEVTIDLDVVVRLELLGFLRDECKKRNCCVIYATHIFDGLGRRWCDRILHLSEGKITDDFEMDKVKFVDSSTKNVHGPNEVDVSRSESLHPLALAWLKEDLETRGSREEEKARRKRQLDEWLSTDDNYFDASNSKIEEYFKASRSRA